MNTRGTAHHGLRWSIIVIATLMLVILALDTAAASALADAVMRGDVERTRMLLAEGADANEPQADGATALHWASFRDNLDSAARLLRAGADARAANRDGATPLSLACANGSAAMIELLLDAGADPNENLPNGETALMMAARTGVPEALTALIERGADVNAAENLRGTTALMWAAAYGNPEAVGVLLDAGADAAARAKPIPAGRGPYLAPTARQRLEEFRTGRGSGGRNIPVNLDGTLADAPAAPPVPVGDDTAENDLREAPRPPRVRPMTGGLTALVFAARQGDIDSARRLLDAGAEVNQVTEYGWTPLLTAVQNRYYQLAALLLARGADPNIANKGGWSSLYIATDNRNIEGGDYPTRKPDMDHLEFIALLLEHGADPNLRMASSTETRTIFTHQWLYEEGATPFLRAAQSSDLVLMRLLVEHGADPSIATENNTTPLMVAAGIGWDEGVTYEWSEQDNIEVINLLLELGADVNAQDNDGRAALHGAAHKGRNDVIRILAAHGADLAMRDFGSRDSIHRLLGKTWEAIDYADGLVRVGVQSAIPHPETARLLRELMADAGLPVPPEGRTLESICITEICQ